MKQKKTETEQLKEWSETKVFEESVRGDTPWVFYEGPPTANGKPGAHHALARSFKDLYVRFHAMQGLRVERKAGWDCHGLPVELEAEKNLGLSNKDELLEYGLPRFNKHCRDSVLSRVDDWELMSERLAFWLDTKNAYATMSVDYMNQVFGALKKLDDKGFLYKGKKVTPHCPRCETTLSSHELDYVDVDTESVFLFLELKEPLEGSKEKEYFLVWTTTPWTLPSNVALALNPGLDYQLVELDNKRVWVSKAFNEKKEKPFKVLREVKGEKLLGAKYFRLYDLLKKEGLFETVAADFVSAKEGSGLVHLAPAHGADDAKALPDLKVPCLLDSKGDFQNAGEFSGKNYTEVNKLVKKDLEERKLLYSRFNLKHSYPHCWRCKTPLLYMPSNSWYLRTTQVRDRMLELNKQVAWYPESAGSKRFANWLETNVDWSLSRQRFWGTPLPVWECECGEYEVLGSKEDLESKCSVYLDDLHRDSLDDLTFSCSCGKDMRRVEDVLDVWFDSGCMPFAQWGSDQDKFHENFPADFVCEGLDQTRGWFYSLLALSTILYDEVPFRRVLCLGLLLDKNGEKMSKSKGNVLDVNKLFEDYGADRLRWFFYSSKTPWEGYQLDPSMLNEETKMLETLEACLDFYSLYKNDRAAENLKDFKCLSEEERYKKLTLLDRWLLVRTEQLTAAVDKSLREYNTFGAAKELESFVDSLSNWFLRLSRKRFWNENPEAFYAFEFALQRLGVLLAPFVPFLAERLYNLEGTVLVDSVHLALWPVVDKETVVKNQELLDSMKTVEQVCSLGRALRAENQVPLRQPLSEVSLVLKQKLSYDMLSLVSQELNVKRVEEKEETTEFCVEKVQVNFKKLGPRLGKQVQVLKTQVQDKLEELKAGSAEFVLEPDGESVVVYSDEVDFVLEAKENTAFKEENQVFVALNLKLTPELLQEGYYREVLRALQQVRKEEELDVSDRVELRLAREKCAELKPFSESLKNELLAVSLEFVDGDLLSKELPDLGLKYDLKKFSRVKPVDK